MALIHFVPPVIAHRGASAYAPENTLAAFTKAAQLGVQWIEFDVRLAACGQPIIFHDELLSRTTNGEGKVSQYPYAYLQTLDAGAWFDPIFSSERIPTLGQVLEFLKDTKMSAHIELKAVPGQEEALVKRVLEEVSHDLSLTDERVIFSSFSLDALFYLRKYSSDCLIGLLLPRWRRGWQAIASSLACVSVHVKHNIVTKEAAQKIKSMNKALLCYTVNDPSRARELFTWGVDAVFSDIPDKLLNLQE